MSDFEHAAKHLQDISELRALEVLSNTELLAVFNEAEAAGDDVKCLKVLTEKQRRGLSVLCKPVPFLREWSGRDPEHQSE